jgi:hypothetical protein
MGVAMVATLPLRNRYPLDIYEELKGIRRIQTDVEDGGEGLTGLQGPQIRPPRLSRYAKSRIF